MRLYIANPDRIPKDDVKKRVAANIRNMGFENFTYKIVLVFSFQKWNNLAKVGDGLNESPTVMVWEATTRQDTLLKIGAY